MSKQTLTITDNRTGKTVELPIENDTIPAIGLRQLKTANFLPAFPVMVALMALGPLDFL